MVSVSSRIIRPRGDWTLNSKTLVIRSELIFDHSSRALLERSAESLDENSIHVWQVPYARAEGRRSLLAVLSTYLHRTPDQITLLQNAHGRPHLADDESLAFNWSHTGQLALIAIARGAQPGIDVERLRARPNALEIARRYFTADEASALTQLPVTEQASAFIRLWTAKEAVLKALGRGIAFGLHRLNLDIRANPPRLLDLEGENPQAWQLHAVEVDSEHAATLAWRGSGRIVQIKGLHPC